VYKHFAILGAESIRTAAASECAAEQEKFWEFHDLIFTDQRSNRSTLNDDKLIALATNLGMDPAAFTECLTSNRYDNQIKQESLSVQSLGVRGTPGFFINGVYVAGAQPYDVFRQIINEQLARLGEEAAPQSAATSNPAPAEGDIAGLIVFPTQPTAHQPGEIVYSQSVPAGGAHSNIWQNCGIYADPVSTETVMHSLEHGAAWIAYRPDLPTEQLEALRNLVRQELTRRSEPMVILSPKADLDAPIVATAWQVQLKLDSPLDPRLTQFLQRYQVGPYTPEPGAPCTGGVGQPEDS